MFFLNPWVFIAFVPLYFFYKRNTSRTKQTKILYLVLLFIFVALSRPVIKNALTPHNFHSQEFVIALDASYSMQADDLKPSRYAMAKEAIKKLLKLHPKDRFTLLLFTSNTLLISPPTTDTAITMQALDSINPLYILTKSTNIAQLFTKVGALPIEHKRLLLFSDGGEEHDLVKLVQLAKKNAITPFIVATASHKGAALKKNDTYIKNAKGALVISKINPTLKDLATALDGKYYELSSLDIVDTLSKDISSQSKTKQQIAVQSYKELFWIPLSVATALFFLGVTKFARFVPFLSLFLLFSPKAESSLLDFYHIDKAQDFYKEAKYLQASKEFKKLPPSFENYYNLATALYKAKHYKEALFYYTQIQTVQAKLKQNIFYNMANTAVKLKKYDQAKKLYRLALVLGEDRDALYNLNLLKKLHLKTEKNPQKMLHSSGQKKKASKTAKKQKKDSQKQSGKSKSNNASTQSSRGSGGDKKVKKSSPVQKVKKKKSNYRLSYKAYEKINKGYIDEKEPW